MMCRGIHCPQPEGKFLVRGFCDHCAPDLHSTWHYLESLGNLKEMAKLQQIDSGDIPAVELLRPQAGDIVIVRHPRHFLAEELIPARDMLQRILPSGCRVVFMPEGFDIKLLRPENAEPYVIEGGKE